MALSRGHGALVLQEVPAVALVDGGVVVALIRGGGTQDNEGGGLAFPPRMSLQELCLCLHTSVGRQHVTLCRICMLCVHAYD
jgi:hypothetical protein